MSHRRRAFVVRYVFLAAIALAGASSTGCLAETSYEIDTKSADHIAFADRDGRELLRPGTTQDDLDFHRNVVLEREANAVAAGAALGFLALQAHDSLTSPRGERGVDIPLAVGFGGFALTTGGIGIYELAAPDSERTIITAP
jgi:hypothetical protein